MNPSSSANVDESDAAQPLPDFPTSLATPPASPPPAVVTVTFASEAMGRQVSYSAIVPTGPGAPPPVVLQLHGSGDDHQSWLRNSNILRHAAGHRLLLVFPDGATSGYLNFRSHGRRGVQRYEDLVMRDLTANVASTFRVADGPWGIGGLSMGGFGAMRLGLKYPERFGSVWSHSGSLTSMPGLEEFASDDDFGVATVAEDLAARMTGGAPVPVISFDCGTEDHLIEANRAFHALLDRLGVPHRYAEHPGGHEWDYWDRHVPAALAQHDRVLNGG